MMELPGESPVGILRCETPKLAQNQVPGLPFDERANGRLVFPPHEEIPFPVPGDTAPLHDLRSFLDGDRTQDVASAGMGIPAAVALPAPLPQAGEELLLESTSRKHIQRSVDRLMGDVLAHIVRVRLLQGSGNLLGGPFLSQVSDDVPPEPGILMNASLPSRDIRTSIRRAISEEEAIPSAVAIPTNLPTDGTGRAVQIFSNGAKTLSPLKACKDVFPIGGIQVTVVVICHGNTVGESLSCCTWSLNSGPPSLH